MNATRNSSPQELICEFPECGRPQYLRTTTLCHAHYEQRRLGKTLKPRKHSWNIHLPFEERFWERVARRGDLECWEWQASMDRKGYGFMMQDRRTRRAHRLAYEFAVGPIPEGKMLDHICHNRRCVNPAHLRPVTNSQNQENRSGPQGNNKSGYRGVSWNSRKKLWMARVVSGGKGYFCGYWPTAEEAAEAARLKRLELHTHNTLDRIA